MKRIILSFFFLILISSFLRSSFVFGAEKEIFSFVDDFTSINDSAWDVKSGVCDQCQNSQVFISNGINLTSEYSEFFPFITSKENIFPSTGNFYIKVRFKYLEVTNFGSGFGFGNIVPEYGLHDYPFKDSDMVKFQVWQDSDNKFYIDTRTCTSPNDCSNDRTRVYKNNNPVLGEHEVSLYNRDGVINVYFDGVKTESSPITNTNWRPTVFWIGNLFRLDSANDWTDIKIIRIESGILSDISGLTKTIIIPGLGASWDIGAILDGNPKGNWQIPDFVNEYDSLVDSFLKAGYTNNQDLFIFPYDWRQPLSVLAGRLEMFINAHTANGEKVNLVGHSMGGLVARAYAQKPGVAKINKLILIGTPNFGAIETYGVWEGATVWSDAWWAKLAFELTTHFGAFLGESKLQTIHRVVPSIKDLLPTYDFLKFGEIFQPWASLVEKNDNLNVLNENTGTISLITHSMYSDDYQTNSLIKAIAHTPEDGELWADGKPIENPFGTVLGDGTVTKPSAIGMFTNIMKGSGWHNELVTKLQNIKTIFSVLGLDPEKAVEEMADNRESAFVAALKSPGILKVCNSDLTICDTNLGIYDHDYKLFMLPGYTNENLVVIVKEDNELGTYKLHLGNISQTADWSILDGNLTNAGQTDFYYISGGDELSVTLDITPPTIEITSPIPGIYQSGSVPKLIYKVTDNLDEHPEYSDGGWSAEEGSHTVTVSATDKAGNRSTKSVTYTVVNRPTLKDQCKKDGWKIYKLFKNQGECVSFIERNEVAKNKYFWWI